MAGHSPEAYLSIRTSCDRCRFHKLKCHPSQSCLESDAESGGPSSERCERCIRAGVNCVFSRRNKSRRATKNFREGHSRVQITRGSEQDVENRHATRSLHASCAHLLEGQNSNPPETDASLARSGRPADQTIAELFAFDDTYIHPPLDNRLGLPGLLSTGDNEYDVLMCNPVGTTIDDTQLYENPEMLPGQWHNGVDAEPGGMMPQSLTAAMNQPQTSNGFPGSEVNGMAFDGVASIGILLRLVADLHTQLAVLEKISWQLQRSFRDLQQYPIGSVLHLSQTFTSLVRDLKSSIPADPAVAPILFSCYVTLTKIYTVVLHQFQVYLRAQPNGRQVCASQLNMRLGPHACLADVPQSNAPRSNIHTAVCMLLESLQQAEKAMPPDLDIKTMDHPWPQPWEGLTDATPNTHLVFRALTSEVADIKQLLREKADL
ncbi:hypothetical protein PENFLA_c009G09482 [Penicillium flavigenum]|uniref:Zn(2)-C6 fungal-type domain-containing protein n=1 Tax=Penicillium flavigenum TaxID=254877 RepID=A0A1V6TF24_9EURO|nr:hypothetical protein PENFLA_c009G09482 [Penicillium flavigenum]